MLWFHFQVTNCFAGQQAIISVINFSKGKSVYRHGMTPVVRCAGSCRLALLLHPRRSLATVAFSAGHGRSKALWRQSVPCRLEPSLLVGVLMLGARRHVDPASSELPA